MTESHLKGDTRNPIHVDRCVVVNLLTSSLSDAESSCKWTKMVVAMYTGPGKGISWSSICVWEPKEVDSLLLNTFLPFLAKCSLADGNSLFGQVIITCSTYQQVYCPSTSKLWCWHISNWASLLHILHVHVHQVPYRLKRLRMGSSSWDFQARLLHKYHSWYSFLYNNLVIAFSDLISSPSPLKATNQTI